MSNTDTLELPVRAPEQSAFERDMGQLSDVEALAPSHVASFDLNALRADQATGAPLWLEVPADDPEDAKRFKIVTSNFGEQGPRVVISTEFDEDRVLNFPNSPNIMNVMKPGYFSSVDADGEIHSHKVDEPYDRSKSMLEIRVGEEDGSLHVLNLSGESPASDAMDINIYSAPAENSAELLPTET